MAEGKDSSFKTLLEVGENNKELLREVSRRVENMLNSGGCNFDPEFLQIRDTLEFMTTEGGDVITRNRLLLSKVEIIENPFNPYSRKVVITPQVYQDTHKDPLIIEIARYGKDLPFELHDFICPASMTEKPGFSYKSPEHFAKEIVKQIKFFRFEAEDQAHFNEGLAYKVRDALEEWLENPTEDFPKIDGLFVMYDYLEGCMVAISTDEDNRSPLVIKTDYRGGINLKLLSNEKESLKKARLLSEKFHKGFVHDLISLLTFTKNNEVSIEKDQLRRHLHICINALIKVLPGGLPSHLKNLNLTHAGITQQKSSGEYLVDNSSSESDWDFNVSLSPNLDPETLSSLVYIVGKNQAGLDPLRNHVVLITFTNRAETHRKPVSYILYPYNYN